jgi:hypothetical protein
MLRVVALRNADQIFDSVVAFVPVDVVDVVPCGYCSIVVFPHEAVHVHAPVFPIVCFVIPCWLAVKPDSGKLKNGVFRGAHLFSPSVSSTSVYCTASDKTTPANV